MSLTTIITGTSRGIGNRLCKYYIGKNHKVISISRNEIDFTHKNSKKLVSQYGIICLEKLNIKEKLREYDESQHQFATFLHNNYSNSAFYKPFLSKCDSAKLPKQTNKNYYSIPGW